jgi:hypothetical protein
MLRDGIWRQAEKSLLRLCGRPTEKKAGSPAKDDRMFVAGLALCRICLRRAGALHGSEIQFEQGLLFVALVFVLLSVGLAVARSSSGDVINVSH